MRIGLIAGEASGDILGAGLIEAIKRRHPDAQFEGIAGPKMIAAGCQSHVPAEKLAVMGLFEVLKHLRELVGIRRRMLRHWKQNPPDVFVGIDAPDFNLPLEAKLRKQGIRTVHYVSPSVWAWRRKRVLKIARAVDRILCLLPFEAAFYDQHSVQAHFVGHPLADELQIDDEQARQARLALAVPDNTPCLAVMPGSRGSELKFLAEPFAAAVAELVAAKPDLFVVAPMARADLKTQFADALRQAGVLDRVRLLDGQSHAAMRAADVILLASGTATLEAMLLGKPMVAAYKFSAATYAILQRTALGKMPWHTLPNLLADERLIPELMQSAATPQALAAELLKQFDSDHADALKRRFAQIGGQLRRDASERAADAVLALIEGAKA